MPTKLKLKRNCCLWRRNQWYLFTTSSKEITLSRARWNDYTKFKPMPVNRLGLGFTQLKILAHPTLPSNSLNTAANWKGFPLLLVHLSKEIKGSYAETRIVLFKIYLHSKPREWESILIIRGVLAQHLLCRLAFLKGIHQDAITF